MSWERRGLILDSDEEANQMRISRDLCVLCQRDETFFLFQPGGTDWTCPAVVDV